MKKLYIVLFVIGLLCSESYGQIIETESSNNIVTQQVGPGFYSMRSGTVYNNSDNVVYFHSDSKIASYVGEELTFVIEVNCDMWGPPSLHNPAWRNVGHGTVPGDGTEVSVTAHWLQSLSSDTSLRPDTITFTARVRVVGGPFESTSDLGTYNFQKQPPGWPTGDINMGHPFPHLPF